MLIIQGYKDIPRGCRGAAIAIGNFDGVHRGHQALITATHQCAAELSAPAGVMVFEPHPRAFFRPQEPQFLLTPLPMKLELLADTGLDFAAVLTFNAGLATLPPENFVTRVLRDGFAVRHVVIGYDFYFGKGRTGTPETMRSLGRSHGFTVTVLAPVAEAGEVFSSSAVRGRLSTGDVVGAARELGHWWRVGGMVTDGAKRGTGMGFPTANITLDSGTALGHGIYAVRVEIGGTNVDGAAYFGQRPTFDNGAPVLEVFLFDFDGDIYGREMSVEFIGFVRPDQRFRDMAALTEQMHRDCARAREILSKAPREPLT
jgi:riboflavin kinase/FMN adenylyltransferase